MKHSIIILDDLRAHRAIEIIRSLSGEKSTHEVVIKPYKVDRSAAQNSLMWLWYGIICSELGWEKDDCHDFFKEKFLVNIFERDDLEYASMIESVRVVWSAGMKAEANAMKNQIIKLTSTTKANVEQFTEYLNLIERHAASIGIVLPHPEDRYRMAMGRAA